MCCRCTWPQTPAWRSAFPRGDETDCQLPAMFQCGFVLILKRSIEREGFAPDGKTVLDPRLICFLQLRDRCALGAKIAKEENAMKVIPTGGDPEKVHT